MSTPFLIRNSTFGIRPAPVYLWFLAKNKNAAANHGFRDRRKQALFINARKLGTMPPKLWTGKTRSALKSQHN